MIGMPILGDGKIYYVTRGGDVRTVTHAEFGFTYRRNALTQDLIFLDATFQGTPDAPDVPSVKRYLKEFLSDRRVVELPPILWQILLRGVVLNTRPGSTAGSVLLW